jgi:hypothetical protein
VTGYPVAELIDRERLMDVLNRSVERARRAREERYEVAAAAREARGCYCWQAGEMCDPCWNAS